MVEEINISKCLNELVVKYQFNLDTLAKYLDLSKTDILELANGNESVLPESYKRRNEMMIGIMFLLDVATSDKDLKLKAFLDVLMNHHHLSKETIASMAEVDAKDIELFLNSSLEINHEIKYKLAITVMTLRFLLKDNE